MHSLKSRDPCTSITEMQMKAKLVRQTLVQKERSLFRCPDLGEQCTPISKTTPFPTQAQGSYRNSEREVLFFYLVILLVYCKLGPYPFIFLVCGTLGVRTSPCDILANGEDSPAIYDIRISGEEVSANQPSESLEVSQLSVYLPTLDTAWEHLGELFGVPGAPLNPCMSTSSEPT